MQGWRKRQEDAHLAEVSKGEKKDIDVFGVFDGHGGKEISKFVSNHFLDELVKNKNLATNMELALKETFIKMDEIMQTKEGIEEIKKYSRQSKEEDDRQSKNEPPNSQMNLISKLMTPKETETKQEEIKETEIKQEEIKETEIQNENKIENKPEMDSAQKNEEIHEDNDIKVNEDNKENVLKKTIIYL